MTLATYRGHTWRVAATRHWPIPHVELETPDGGRLSAPAHHCHIHEERP
ncbi:hypothetical protein [Rhodococcus marinonascens]|nr:hypothetical protein [Rhodococcus marinonascens]